MRILLKLTLDCDADAAWRAVHSPRALAELYAPLVELSPLVTPPAFIEPGTDVPVQLHLLGAVPLGRQLIHTTERYIEEHRGGGGAGGVGSGGAGGGGAGGGGADAGSGGDAGGVRILRDSGIPLTGPLAALDVWDHQMAVSPAPGDPAKTLWRDRLVIGGAAALPLWPVLWATWQWRAARLRAVAPTWAYDPEFEADHT